jgi:hypothetical protein
MLLQKHSAQIGKAFRCEERLFCTRKKDRFGSQLTGGEMLALLL